MKISLQIVQSVLRIRIRKKPLWESLHEVKKLIAELVSSKVDLIVTPTTPAILVARQATTTIPIVMSSCYPSTVLLLRESSIVWHGQEGISQG